MKKPQAKPRSSTKRNMLITILPFFLLFFLNTGRNDKNIEEEYSKAVQKGVQDTAISVLNNMCKELIEVKGEYAKADTIAHRALILAGKAHYKKGLADTYNYLGENEWYKNNHPGAIENYAIAEKIEQAIGYKDGLLKTLSGLSDVYESQGDFGIALYEEKEVQNLARMENAENATLQKEQSKKQRLIIYFIIGILLLAVAFAVFAYRNYLDKKRKEKQLTRKNTEITDSINSALRIQQAMLPNKKEIAQLLPESFVLFKPKDIVSGDFYFCASQPSKGGLNTASSEISPLGSGGAILLAAADCTGHGVPGALMSMICMERLHDAVEKSDEPADILNLLNKGIRRSLHQSEQNSSPKDGMDIALLAISQQLSATGFKIEFSGANRPLWIIRKDADTIEEIKPTKMAIGGFTGEEQRYECNTVELQHGDTFYLFSDGYADQFGGDMGKKLTTRKFKETLLSIKNKPMKDQESELIKAHETWKQKEEQLDDILVIGVRV